VSDDPETQALFAPGEAPEFRRQLLAVSVRAVLWMIALVVGYYLLPLSGRFDTSEIILLVLGLAGFSVVLFWQIREITRNRYPRARAVQAVAILVPLLLILFASTYYLMSRADPGYFSMQLSRTTSLYFTVTVLSTVGFGDIVPRVDAARVVTMIQMLVDLVTFGLIIHLILGAVRVGVMRQAVARNEEARE
jgi:hypothetical protein